MHDLTTVIVFVYGLVFGSFFNVVGLRLPQDNLFSKDRSYCDNCQRTLTWIELIPVFSFLVQAGKCRKCKQPISWLYPIMELATGLLAAYSFIRFGWSKALILGFVLISLLIPVTVADLSYRKIPNKLLLFFTPLFIILKINQLVPSLIGAALAFFLLFLIIVLSKGGMGAGDLKLLTLLGFIFEPIPFLLLFFLATLYGVVGGLITMTINKTGRQTAIPFGPYISLAAMTVYFYGPAIIRWYLSLIG